MKKLYKKFILLTLAVAFLACSSEDDLIDDWIETNEIDNSTTGSSGDADLSKLVALGTSLGAGFMDGALYNDGQANSFPALLANQFQIEGIGGASSFVQPSINSENGYNFLLNDGTSGRTELSLSLEAPVPTTGDITSILTPYSGATSGLNNFSVPVAQAGQLVIEATGGLVTDTYGGAVPAAANPAYNPFYGRFASNPSATGAPGSGSTPLTDALSAQGTFFIYEAGVNDVALWAAGGGTTAIGPLTDQATFESSVDGAIQALALSGGAQGVVLNIPPILTFPFFQAVQYNAIQLDEATAGTLQEAFDGVNQVIQGTAAAGYTGDVSGRLVNYSAGNNPILVIDQSLDDLGPFFDGMLAAGAITAQQREQVEPYRQSRPMVAGELVPLTTGAVLGVEADGDDTVADTPLGVAIPLGFDLATGMQEPAGGDPYYLDASELGEIEVAIGGFNASLEGAVSDVNAAGGDIILVDIESIFLDAAGLSDGVQGITVQGLELDPDFGPNGIFSTDGIHPCNRGHGIVANEIIAAINANWNANIPEIDIQSLRGPVFIP